MPEPGVRPDEHEQVREARDRRTAVPLHPAASPGVGQRALAPVDLLGHRRRRDLEAGGEHDGVDLVLGPVPGHDRAGPDLGDRVGLHVRVRRAQRGVEVVRDEDALAADPVVGPQLLA